MKYTSANFKKQATQALADPALQGALRRARDGFINKRRAALDDLPEFEQLRKQANAIKRHTLAYLDTYLEYFEQQVLDSGGHVHWAQDGSQARQIIVDICQNRKAQHITKGKTMVGEEASLNEALVSAGLEVTETDLGEYIIQLANEPPSHIIAPAVHKNREQIAELFRMHHTSYEVNRLLASIPEIVDEARAVLRDKFLQADIGITGANFLIAQTGSAVIVTNEGNGDLTATLPRTHIIITSIEKIVPTLEDCSVLLRLLARSATGQDMTAYTTFFSGPKRQGDLDGPEEFHVVLMDNGRSNMLATGFRDMLRCLHCGACLNHCPVYNAIGGHAFGWVYPGPMGAVLTPLLQGLQSSADLPFASTLCGRCEEVCPVSIPLPRLLRQHRNQAQQENIVPLSHRLGLALWAWLARHPRWYRVVIDNAVAVGGWLGRRRGRFSHLPLAGSWTDMKDMPAPQGQGFVSAWQKQQRSKGSKS